MEDSNGVLIGLGSAFGSIGVVLLCLGIFYYFRYTERGRILLSRASAAGGFAGAFDDEAQLAIDEAEAMETMDDAQQQAYYRAKAFCLANPPESIPTDISLSQFLAIQEKGVSAWEFEPELEVANLFVEARTEIAFYNDCDTCCVQSNLPVPKQNDVYYWEAKLYDKPESTSIAIGMATKPYPLFRLPGYHRHSIAYLSDGTRRHNQPFGGSTYGPSMLQGDVVGVGYRPRTGTIFFTRNGKKLEDIAHGVKMNLFPTIGANGPCSVHVNLGQLGFVFIEANVKKWGLAPSTGSLAPPPPYGSEQGSVLLEIGQQRRSRPGPSNSSPLRDHHASSSREARDRSRDGAGDISLSTLVAPPPIGSLEPSPADPPEYQSPSSTSSSRRSSQASQSSPTPDQDDSDRRHLLS